ncbi:hypothetical protein EDC04DRAFT_945733 [Pisolithus marmoratus]|nr:hypothetical protein EDC04DRAFT_945733 [Pisolithus marmoratus]
MHSKPSVLPLLGHAPRSILTVQHSESPASQENFPLDYSCCVAAPGYDCAIIDGWEPQGLISAAGDDCAGSSEALQLPSCPTPPAPFLVPNSNLVDHLYRGQDSTQVALLSRYVPGESGPTSIVSALASQTCGWWGTQDHASDHLTNHNATPSSPHTTNLLQLDAIGRLLRYSHEDENVLTFGDPDHGSAGPTMGLFSILFHDNTSGQIDSNAVSSSPFPFLQDTHLSGDLTSANFLLSPEQFQTEMAAPAQFLSSPTTRPINQWVPSPICLALLICSVP